MKWRTDRALNYAARYFLNVRKARNEAFCLLGVSSHIRLRRCCRLLSWINQNTEVVMK